jgi:hypothetical protein
MNHNNLLILERSSNTLSFESKNGEYVLEGVFGEIDKKNRNNRIYTEDEYVPQIEALQAKIKSSKLLGELDHPAKFDISLKNVSHVIEDLYYDKDSKEVKGKIRLLDTDAGKQAKALVDAGVPLHISSRAAGAVESNGQVKIKQLFTYDLVADPGFENAQLNRVNESYGFSNDSNISIFEVTEDSMLTETETIETENKIENNQIMENKARFVSVEDFNKYSAYLAEEIKALKESLAGTSTDNIEEKMNALTSYVEYVAERADRGIQYTEYVAENLDNTVEYSNYLAENLDKSIDYSNYVAENLDKSIDYSNYVAEKLDESISYTEHVAESASKIKEYANYLAEAMNEGAADYNNVTKYLNYLKENVESVSEYADYIAETINTNLIVEDEAGIEVEDMESDMKEVDNNVTDPEDKSAEQMNDLDKAPNASKEVAESEEPGIEADDMKSDMKEVDNNVTAPKDKSAELMSELEDEVDDAGEEVVDAVESYKSEISEKLSALINKATEKKNNNPHFFKFVSESTQNKYNELEEADKAKVLSSIEGRGYLTESQINTLMESALVEVAGQNVPYFIEAMPSEYKDTWAKLSEAKKSSIAAQAKMVKLNTPYQVKNFWDTRDLRETAPVMEKVEMVNESKVEAPKKSSTITYNVDGMAEAFAKRFNK